MTRRAWVLLGLLALVAAFAAWLPTRASETRICTLAGCTSSAGVSSTGPDDGRGPGRTAEFCLDDRCTTGGWDVDPDRIAMAIDGKVRVSSASLRIMDGGGEVVSYEWEGRVRAKPSYPNGKRCEPTCWDLWFTLEDGSLVPNPDASDAGR